ERPHQALQYQTPAQIYGVCQPIVLHSTLQLHRMMTVAANIIVRELGSLPKPTQKEAEGKLKLLFGIK
ncbi:MAG: hypothetical protein M1485_07530, partial [Chloroflexi bacterium]|nr:hypothetical protein [Chloroflexota bacterium]